MDKKEIDTEAMPITPEMEKHFREYLLGHIKKVVSFAKALLDSGYIDEGVFEYIRDNHDRSKLKEPEYTPYVRRKWFEREGQKEMYDSMGDDVKRAIATHVVTNGHHPECWSEDYKGFTSDEPCHVIGMPEESVIEMVCDWNAMGLEHGNTARWWYEKCRNTRWIFDHHTEKLIEKWLKNAEELSL